MKAETTKLKSLKASPLVHKELKIYVTASGRNMVTETDAAIMKYLKSKGHVFTCHTKKAS